MPRHAENVHQRRTFPSPHNMMRRPSSRSKAAAVRKVPGPCKGGIQFQINATRVPVSRHPQFRMNGNNARLLDLQFGIGGIFGRCDEYAAPNGDRHRSSPLLCPRASRSSKCQGRHAGNVLSRMDLNSQREPDDLYDGYERRLQSGQSTGLFQGMCPESETMLCAHGWILSRDATVFLHSK